jgi:hypothetical protein
MNKLKSINDKLNEACSLLDGIANDIAKTGIIQKTAWIKNIGKSLVSIFEIQQGIYLEEPDLKPAEFEGVPKDEAANKRFRELLLGIRSTLVKNKPLDAIEELNNFIATNPPQYLRDCAVTEINVIKKDFNV